MARHAPLLVRDAVTPASLRSWREGRKLSRRDAADILGLSERTLETLEYGRNATSALFPVLERLTLALDRIDELRRLLYRPPMRAEKRGGG